MMAIGGLTTQNSYARIENLIFSKGRKSIIADVVLYPDNSCEQKIGAFPIKIVTIADTEVVPDYIATEPVAGAQPDGTTRLYKTVTPGISGWNNHIVKFATQTGDGGSEAIIHSTQPHDGKAVRVESDNKLYIFDGSLWQEQDQTKVFDSVAFDAMFGIAAQNAADKNLTEIVYDYIMSLPEYAHCTGV